MPLLFGIGPLDAAGLFDVVVVADAGDVAGLVFGEGFDGLEGDVRAGEFFHEFAASPAVGESLDNAEVVESLTGCFFDLANGAEATLGVDEGAVFFTPARSREDEIRHLGGFGRLIHVLDDEEIEFFADASEVILGDPGVVGIGGDDPESFDFAFVDGFDDLVVGVAGGVLDLVVFDAHEAAHFFAVGGVAEVVSAKEVGGVGEEARAHGVALASDGVGSGTGLADVAGHQLQVDDGLRGTNSLVALIDAHGPPPGDAFVGLRDEFCERFDLLDSLACLRRDHFWGVIFDEFLEVFKAFGVGERVVVEALVADDAMSEAVEKVEVGFGGVGDVAGGDLGGFGAARVDDDDLGIALVAHHTLPHDRVGDGRVGSDEDEDVGLFEVRVGVGWGVEAEGLLVGDYGGGHALTGVAIAVFDAHAELAEGAEHEEVFYRDLAGGDEGDGFFAVLLLDGFKVVAKGVEGGVPVYGLAL